MSAIAMFHQVSEYDAWRPIDRLNGTHQKQVLAATCLVFPVSGRLGALSFFFSDRSSDTILAALANRGDLRLLVCFRRAGRDRHSNRTDCNATPTHS